MARSYPILKLTHLAGKTLKTLQVRQLKNTEGEFERLSLKTFIEISVRDLKIEFPVSKSLYAGALFCSGIGLCMHTVNALKLRTLVAWQKGLDKQCRPRSDCF